MKISAFPRVIYVPLFLVLASASPAMGADPRLVWEELPELPDALGVAGPFVGVHNEALLVAGGANFPNPVWETQKVWYDRIYVMTRSQDGYRWRESGKLHKPIAYGSAISTPSGVLCLGGNDATATFDSVFLLQWNPQTENVEIVPYPPLPRACAYGAATIANGVVYIAGGQSGSSLDSAMTNFWALDLTQNGTANFAWSVLPAWPGPSRAFNLTVYHADKHHDRIYVMSGRRQESADISAIEFLCDVWEFSLTTRKWSEKAALPRCVMGGTAATVGDSHVFVLGGDDGSLFAKANSLREAHPGFVKEALAYNTYTNTWRSAGLIPANHVTTIAVEWLGGIVVPTGEIRPRVRSPKVWRVTRAQ